MLISGWRETPTGLIVPDDLYTGRLIIAQHGPSVVRQASRAESRRRRASRSHDRVQRRVESRGERMLNRFYARLFGDAARRVRRLGSRADVESALLIDRYEAEFRAAFIRWGFSVAALGVEFERSWIRSAAPRASRQWAASGLWVQAADDDALPDITVEMPDRMARGIRGWLSKRANQAWSGVKKAVRKVLGREIADGLKDGDSVRDLEKRIRENAPNKTKWQAKVIARTESTSAMNFGQQAEREDAEIEWKEWSSTIDAQTRSVGSGSRFDHLQPDGQVVPNDQPFLVSGQNLMFPGDGSLGASAANLINCFLPGTRMSGRVIAGARSFYSGQAVEIETSFGAVLRVTDHHPILSEDGLVPAGTLEKGDNLLHSVGDIDNPPSGVGAFVSARLVPNEDHEPTSVEQIFRSLSSSQTVEHRRGTPVDFHGDGQSMVGEIEIVRPRRVLLDHAMSGARESLGQFSLKESDAVLFGEHGVSAPGSFVQRMDTPTASVPGTAALSLDGGSVGLEFGPFQEFRFGAAANIVAGFPDHAANRIAIDSELTGQGQSGFPGDVPFDQSRDYSPIVGRPVADGGEFVGVSGGPECDAGTNQPPFDRAVIDPEFPRQFLERFPGQVSLGEVVRIRKFRYSGHVYDFQSPFGWVGANGIIASNCRCASVAAWPDDPLDTVHRPDPVPPAPVEVPPPPPPPPEPPAHITHTGRRTEFSEQIWKEIGDGIATEDDAIRVGQKVLDRIIEDTAEHQERVDALQREIDDATAAMDSSKRIRDYSEAFDRRMEASERYDRAVRVRDRERGRRMRIVLEEIRDVGGVDQELAGDNRRYPSVRNAEGFFPSDWLRKSREQGALNVIEAEDGRAYYAHQDDEIALVPGDKAEITIHELCHRMEHVVRKRTVEGREFPGIRELEAAFKKRRVGSEEPSRIYPNKEGNKEVGYKDDFVDHYIGKEYSGSQRGYHEVLSMGAQLIVEPGEGDGNVWNDPDMVKFVLGVFAGV